MSSWDEAWQVARVNPGVKLLVKLRRTGGLADSPQEQQVRAELGAHPAVAAEIGDCQSVVDDPTNLLCSEYHVPVTVVSETPVILGDVLPRDLNVRSGGTFGLEVFNQQQTWTVEAVRRTGRVSEPQRQEKKQDQETPPADPEGPFPNLGLATTALIVMLGIAFLITGAGQRLVDAGIEATDGGGE